jgi:hypothetical protein
MKRKTLMFIFLVANLIVACGPVFAHHGNSAYDMDKTVPLKATITKFEFSNPHIQIYFDVPDENGAAVHWVAETHNPAMLSRVGWNRDTLKPGDQVTLFVNPNKVGARVVFLEKVVFADGRELDCKKAY